MGSNAVHLLASNALPTIPSSNTTNRHGSLYKGFKMDWKLLATTFGTLFVAELGDKTQLACMLLTAKTERPWTVFIGSSMALVLVSFLGVLFANAVCQYVSPNIIKKIAAAAFVVMGGLMFLDKL